MTTPGQPIPGPAQPGHENAALSTERAFTVDGGIQEAVPGLVNRQRIPQSVDKFGELGELGTSLKERLVKSRAEAVSNLHLGMHEIRQGLSSVQSTLAVPLAPELLVGVLHQPDGSPAGPVQIEFNPATVSFDAAVVSVRSDKTGAFSLPMPMGMPLPADSSLQLQVSGANATVPVSLPNDRVAANGLVGAIVLTSFLDPLPVSVLAALEAMLPPASSDAPAPTPATPAALPEVTLGEHDGCTVAYGVNTSVDRFPYGVFFRLVEPRTSIVSQVETKVVDGKSVYLPIYTSSAKIEGSSVGVSANDADLDYVDRVPVEQPISVDGFRDQLAGLEGNGVFTADETRPMAGTLGLGYVLWLSQQWTLQGLGLGDLVYSLPLAPGEQQQVAIFERADTARVSESEFFSQDEVLRQAALADTSTQATFQSAFQETVNGSSSFSADSDSSSWGVAGGLGAVLGPVVGAIGAGGGSGSSSSSGSSSQSLSGQRSTTQRAAQNTHSAASSQASARRNAARTGMRIATASESQSLTTKTVTNHNHTRALTMQYWEVQRLYDVTTAIDGLTITVLVPLQVVRFMPANQPALLTTSAAVDSRAEVLARYRAIIKEGDVLARALPRRYRHGLTMLLNFAADPTAEVRASGAAARDVIQLALNGTFLPCEDVWVSAVTARGTRVGPVKLTNNAAPIPEDTFASRDELVKWLQDHRQGTSTSRFTGALALPSTMSRSDIAGFEISRRFRKLAYTLVSPAIAGLKNLQGILLGIDNSWVNQALESALSSGAATPKTVFLTPAQLEREVGGPRAEEFSATVDEPDGIGGTTGEQYAAESLSGIELPSRAHPVPARQLAPVLRYNEILEIEKMAQHVVRNTLSYSRAVWSSMTADERAVMLEAYTVGVTPGGVEDASQTIPLLNCVENRPLGYFGNSMILPFIIPQALAEHDTDGEALDGGKIQEALLAYQKASFRPPHSTIALPTRGVLGEAVLGNCPSAEKIDLTRFWNWKDSPGDIAPTISPVTLPVSSPSQAGDLTVPNSLTGLNPLINNVLNAPAPDSLLLTELAKSTAAQTGFEPSLTGASELAKLLTSAQTAANSAREDALKTANAARAEALKGATDIHAQAMATAGNIVGGLYAGNPNAGSDAAAAVHGKDVKNPPKPANAKPDGTKPPPAGGGKVETDDNASGTTNGEGTAPAPAPAPPPLEPGAN